MNADAQRRAARTKAELQYGRRVENRRPRGRFAKLAVNNEGGFRNGVAGYLFGRAGRRLDCARGRQAEKLNTVLT